MTTVGEFVSRRRGWVLGAWLVLAAALWTLVPPMDPAASELTQYLPPDLPSQRVIRRMRELFPGSSGQGEAVVVFERRGSPLTAADLNAIESFAARVPRSDPSDEPGTNLDGLHVRSPRSIPLPHNPLISEATPQGQAALVVVEIPVDFISIRAARVVRHVRGVLAASGLPEGLSVAVTGSAGYGCDYGAAAEESNRRTSLATVTAVLLILVLVYRAPLAALVPLAAVSLAAVVVIKLRTIFSYLGLHSGTAEAIFVFVLLYGAGTDYSLLLISRYREYVLAAMSPRRAVAAALDSTLPAILASGVTNALGLLTLCSARYRIFQTTGPAVAVAFGLMMLAAITLVPALLSFFSGAIFWPRRRGIVPALEALSFSVPPGGPQAPRHAVHLPPGGEYGKGSPFWRRLSIVVTGRPLLMLAGCLVLLAFPAVTGARVEWHYDLLTTLGNKYGAVRGMEMAARHWPPGEMGPTEVLVEAIAPLPQGQWRQLAARLTDSILHSPGVQDVRGLSQPVGKAYAAPAPSLANPLSYLSSALVAPLAQQAAARQYLSEDGRAMRMTVILRDPVLSLAAMRAVDDVRTRAQAVVHSAVPAAEVLLGGTTPYMQDERAVTSSDFRRIIVLTVGVIFVILLVLLRRPALAIFLAACTVLGYLAALGITQWVFTGLLHADGLDWKVQVFLFVVMVAVGVDYSIFLGARMVEESRKTNPGLRAGRGAAIRRAVVHTGPVISSCGVIMAATLGSLMTADLALLHQLGFAMALGMLLDTFLVRPLLVPSFAALLARRKKRQ